MSKLAMTALLAWVTSVGAAAADSQQVDIIGDTFFPPIVIVSPGDTIVFHNRDGLESSIRATDGSWETAPVTKGNSVSIEVTADMTKTYNFAGAGGDGGIIAIAE